MRRFALLFCFIMWAAGADAAWLTGTIKYPDGRLFNGKVRMTLSNPGRDSADSTVLVPRYVEYQVRNGALPSRAAITANTGIQPANTYYWAQYYDAYGVLVMEAPYYVEADGSNNFNLGAAVPTTITTTNISYSQVPSTGSCPAGSYATGLTVSGPTCALLGDWTGSSGITTLGTIANQTTFTKGLVVTPATITLNNSTIITDASLSNHFRVTLDANCPCVLDNPANPADGMHVVWELIQDATGTRTMTLGSKFALGTDISSTTLTVTASKRDFLEAFYNSTADKWYVVRFVKGY